MDSTLSNSGGSSRVRTGLRTVYHKLLELATGGKGLKRALPGGEIVRILPAYRYTKWNPTEYHAFKACLQPGGVVLDIGANAGNYSLLFGRCVGPAGKVFAFEPAPEAFAGLVRHVQLNALDTVVFPAQAAVSDQTGESYFIANGFQGGNRLLGLEEKRPAKNALRVPCVTVDAFCAAKKIVPDFIKIDVEGFELAVLRGARQTIQSARKNSALFVELHPGLWPKLGYARHDLERELALQELRVEPWQGPGDPWTEDLGVALRIHKQSKQTGPSE